MKTSVFSRDGGSLSDEVDNTIMVLVDYIQGFGVDAMIDEGDSRGAIKLLQKAARLARTAGDRKLGRELDVRASTLLEGKGRLSSILEQSEKRRPRSAIPPTARRVRSR